jgi:hypothetical protein
MVWKSSQCQDQVPSAAVSIRHYRKDDQHFVLWGNRAGAEHSSFRSHLLPSLYLLQQTALSVASELEAWLAAIHECCLQTNVGLLPFGQEVS